jgi:mono/diheme cytochrome c family protein
MKKIFKWIGIVLGSLVGLVLIVGIVLYFVGNARLNKTYDFPPSDLTIPTDEASIAMGKHRVETLCIGCHGDDLSGETAWIDAPPLATIDSANLTSGEGGIGREFTSDEDYVRAIRHGIDEQGKPTLMIAVPETAHLSDEELAAIIAYLKTIPPVDHVTHGAHFSVLGKIMVGAGGFGKLPAEAVSHDIHVTAPPVGNNVEYGKYLIDISGCTACHGSNLAGGHFADPSVNLITPNLTPGGELGVWTEEEFLTALKTGVTPSVKQLDPELMPRKETGRMTDDELMAIWTYLQSLPKLPQFTE